MNAIAHAVEALYAKDANPVTSMLAERGIAAIAYALPKIVRDGGDVTARSDASKLDEAAAIAVAAPYWNPRPIEEAGIRALLDDAIHGRRPQN